MTPAEHKQLKNQLTGLLARKEDLLRTKRESEIELNRLQSKIDTIQEKFRESSQSAIIISEHALLRYLERVKKLDLEQIKNEICGTDYKKLKPIDGLFPVNKHKIKIKNGTIVTVLTE